ncbi:ATP-dependent DNA helicase II subunit 1 [Aspergillus awamori]|uniref:ATP-dependent DNA helicase II subunit 1 n=1 Tax=Aspergillus awamori TaxID=105351 RepID=A0A401L8C6_ASPAW|nr:ATP-dependent DNA helicase II subunit 1 [Aspergillus awamori]GKZ58532.1 ATP-dependent DNA helicase II subunit 1 [Aspergillus niger]GKZ68290.1 ATP-dependent DNA helicase II subunit 1 [Aspergillus niger]GLA01019.1 ATP-dependent DNA helicase II subunit 1 [Aspergillus niger]
MADGNPHREDEAAEEEEEIDETSYKPVKDAVLFAIDVSDSMLTPRPSADPKKHTQESPTTAALKCAYHFMQQRIISNPQDMMGVLLFGTQASKFFEEDEDSRGDLSYPNCYLFTDLDVPSAHEVKELRALVDDEGESREVLSPAKEQVSMANVLFCANQIFTSRAPNFLSRRLFIITDNDNPHGDDKTLRSAATVRAKDLYDLGVTIELFPISRPEHEFKNSKFYDDIIYKSSPSDPEAPAYLQSDSKAATATGDGISLLNTLLSSINSRTVPRRTHFSNMPLELGPDFRISVSGYILLRRQAPARNSFIWLNGEKPVVAKGVTSHSADDTGRTVEKWEIRKAYKFGGDQVTFSPDEQKALRDFGEPVIRVIGFKPITALPFWANVKHPYFIYPSEEDYVGSSRVFSALHQTLLRSKKMALVWFIARKGAGPVLAAMIAGEEKLDENGVQKYPPGMWILPLPFADDIRQNPETTLNVAPESLIDQMRVVVQQLQLPKGVYEPLKYPNPSLQWHYRILQALALDEDLPEKPEDKTIPKYRQIDKRAGDYVLSWADELEKQYAKTSAAAPRPTSTLVKRGSKDRASETEDSKPSKKIKVEEDSGSLEEEVRRHHKKGTLSKLTVAILKDFLTSNGRSNAGKKADLIERVEEFLEQ